MLVASSTFAGSNFQDRVANCVNTSIAYARYATMAGYAVDSDHAAFIAYIQQIADKNETPEAKALIVHLGELAWKSREHKSVQEDTLKMFTDCYSGLGLKL